MLKQKRSRHSRDAHSKRDTNSGRNIRNRENVKYNRIPATKNSKDGVTAGRQGRAGTPENSEHWKQGSKAASNTHHGQQQQQGQ
jgi:hypothetical protein